MKYITKKEAKEIQIAALEKLISVYEDVIEKLKNGQSVNKRILNIAESEYIDKTIAALKAIEYSDEWTRYTNNTILKSMAEEIVKTPCPDYTRYYGVRAKEGAHD